MKNKIIIIFVFLLLCTVIYSTENQLCENKRWCFNSISTVQEKVDELGSLSVGGLQYKDLEERSQDIPVSIQALYEEARMYKELAQLRADYEGTSREALLKYIIEVEQKQRAKPEPQQIGLEQAQQNDVESYQIIIDDDSIWNRNLIIEYKDGKWTWCKEPLNPFSGKKCKESDKKTPDKISEDEADEKFVDVVSLLKNRNFDSGLDVLFRRAILLGLKLVSNNEEVKVEEKMEQGAISEIKIKIKDKRFTVSGKTEVTNFFDSPTIPEKNKEVLAAFRNLVTRREVQRASSGEEQQAIEITQLNQGKTADKICQEAGYPQAEKLRQCVDAGGNLVDVASLQTFGRYESKLYPCNTQNPQGTVWDSVFCEGAGGACQSTFGNDFIEIKQDSILACDEGDKNLCCAKKEIEEHIERIREGARSQSKQLEIIGPARSPRDQRNSFLDYLGAKKPEACGPSSLNTEEKAQLLRAIPRINSPKTQRIIEVTNWLSQNDPQALEKINDLDKYSHCRHVQGLALDVRFKGMPNIYKEDFTEAEKDEIKEFRNFMCSLGWANLGSEWWHYEILSTGYNQAKQNNECHWGTLKYTAATVEPNYAYT